MSKFNNAKKRYQLRALPCARTGITRASPSTEISLMYNNPIHLVDVTTDREMNASATEPSYMRGATCRTAKFPSTGVPNDSPERDMMGLVIS